MIMWEVCQRPKFNLFHSSEMGIGMQDARFKIQQCRMQGVWLIVWGKGWITGMDRDDAQMICGSGYPEVRGTEK
jgi:hypothetical protein